MMKTLVAASFLASSAVAYGFPANGAAMSTLAFGSTRGKPTLVRRDRP